MAKEKKKIEEVEQAEAATPIVDVGHMGLIPQPVKEAAPHGLDFFGRPIKPSNYFPQNKGLV